MMTCPLPTIINYNTSAIEIDTLVVAVVVVVVVLVLMCAVGSSVSKSCIRIASEGL